MAGSNEVNKNLDEWNRRVAASLHGLMEYYAAKGEDYMKQHAPWTDRTGHARQSLFGVPFAKRTQLLIRYAHAVDYGVYLELANQGLYAILEPTAKKMAPNFYSDVRRLISK